MRALHMVLPTESMPSDRASRPRHATDGQNSVIFTVQPTPLLPDPLCLATLEPPELAKLVHGFATRNKLRRVRRKAAAGPLTATTTNESRQRINRAANFPTSLADRKTNFCTQTDLDAGPV
ncbi:hypothetical protein [Saccharopolyspora gloriosae]|uniref:hypothetical protein n=1 Tax=Saccharopolyspora gloriosae TaxID=455344 RepID=UPI001FB7591C|nr:hypothetical protein [Saccharopolyspora gloriosae]